MITSAFLALAASTINWILGLFPSAATFPQAAHDAATYLGGYFGVLDPIAPIATMITLVALVITIELFFFLFRTVRWLISHIPSIGGKGV
jgi:uncharacterized membrane protein